jgi:hypothetical protein
MGGSVPQMAVSHDERLASIYAELGIEQDYLLDYRQNDLSQELISKFDRLMQSRTEISHQIREMHDSQFVPRCALNKEELRAWALRTFDASTANE